jgi:2-polyprenyl-3-methyl-5-hydroxy-6-metoxy-1,4-benzoquinol methylase
MTIRYEDPRAEMLAFIPDDARSLLDVGCSVGAFGAELRRSRPHLRLVGIEPNTAAANHARAIYDELWAATFPEIEDALLDNGRFDVIVFNDVLEHMPAPELALRASRRLLDDNGVVVTSIPNVRHISVSGMLLARGEWRYRDAGILDDTHLRFFTKRSILRFFEDNGWQVERMVGLNRVLHVGDADTPRWVRLIGRLSAGRTDDLFFVQYATVASPFVA